MPCLHKHLPYKTIMTNQELDKKSHPWPAEGEWFNFRFREAVWFICRPWYAANNKWFNPSTIWFTLVLKFKVPFFTYNISLFGKELIHGYIGWKPIPVAHDPAFCWNVLPAAQELIKQDKLFVQLSGRVLGFGSISNGLDKK